MSTKETLPPLHELSRLALLLGRQFINRWDLYPKQLDDGRYVTIHEFFNTELLLSHLTGDITLGTYLLNSHSEARFVVLDADDEKGWQQLVTTAAALQAEEVPAYLETSRRGGHLWLFLPGLLFGDAARAFGLGLMAHHKLQDIELYPKQEELSTGPGSLIRLPFGIHRKAGRRYGFVRPNGEALAPRLREQIELLSRPQRVPEPAFRRYRFYETQKTEIAASEPLRAAIPAELASAPVSERIKAAMTVREFVNAYLPEARLNDRGIGYCPLHDDQVQSFGVNEEENFWHCFAGCGGGSVIDLWMQYRGLDFKEAVKELAAMLL